MSSSGGTIARLQEGVVSRLRSSFTVGSVSQCLREVLQNSLDAFESASSSSRTTQPLHIEIRADLTSMVIQVSDNGPGIPPNELQSVGERYFTSKCRTLADLDTVTSFGFRGEALASIGEVALLEVHSRYGERPGFPSPVFRVGELGFICCCLEGSTQAYQKIIKGGKVLNYGPSTMPHHHQQIGTTVVIRDLFFNLPVRKKMVSICCPLFPLFLCGPMAPISNVCFVFCGFV